MPTAETVVCPYCNAFVPAPPDASPGRRVTCPRCAETFAYLRREGVTGTPPSDRLAAPSPSTFITDRPAPLPADADTLRAKARLVFRVLLAIGAVLLIVGAAYLNSLVSNGLAIDFSSFAGVAVPLVTLLVALGGAAFLWLWFFRVPRSNRATALFVVANMVVLALLALGGALETKEYRRRIDAGLPPRPKRSPVMEEIVPAGPTTVAPANLAALGYLPPKIDLVAGVHVAELLSDPTGRKLIEEPLKFGNAEMRLADLPRKIGLEARELDHFVVGMRIDEPLSVVFVVRTLQPYEALKVRQALNARILPGDSGKRTLYQVAFPAGNLPALLWCADERTLLIGLANESLLKANIPGGSTADSLTPEVRTVLSERVRPVGPLWIVGNVADWNKTAAGLLLARLPEGWQQQLAAVRTFGIWAVIADKTLTLNAAMRCDNDKTVERLERWLMSRADGKNSPKLARDGNWLSLQMRTDPDTFRGLLAP
jgi:hypothetical protein